MSKEQRICFDMESWSEGIIATVRIIVSYYFVNQLKLPCSEATSGKYVAFFLCPLSL